ncbi:hypothetical protein B0H16DRAFT_1460099 [Mycena metata]|uniref:Chromatin elongation factor spt5 n=1 Tax=Mycena metata TaxID=1033252 RepID=A0AAD7IYP1_9AGAR|nr:hypothetical protein B0H16DRAFT_1460099 [Mycena metata]
MLRLLCLAGTAMEESKAIPCSPQAPASPQYMDCVRDLEAPQIMLYSAEEILKGQAIPYTPQSPASPRDSDCVNSDCGKVRDLEEADAPVVEQEDPMEFMIRRADLDRLDDLAFHPTRCTFWPDDPAAFEDDMANNHFGAELGVDYKKSVVWRVRVLAGSELTVAATIQRLCTFSNGMPGIETATAIKEFRGSVFVFARAGIDPTKLLRRVAYVKMFPLPRIVDLEEEEKQSVDLLWSWVRIVRPGLYCGDLGKVIQTGARGDAMTVLVVPRLALGERVRRKRELFAPSEAFCSYGGYTFHHGLLALTGIFWYDVSEEYVNPLPEEEALFAGIGGFWAPLKPKVSIAEVGDQVMICGGRWEGYFAEIITLNQESNVQLDLCNQDDRHLVKPFFVPRTEVKLCFGVLDQVEVIRGFYAGDTGYVQAVDWEKRMVDIGQRRTPLLDLRQVDTKKKESLWRKLDGEAQFRLLQVAMDDIRLVNRRREKEKSLPFEQTEVVITGGNAWRGYFGSVIRTSAKGDYVEVAVEGLAVGRPKITLEVGHVLERTTRLPLALAQRLGPAIHLARLRTEPKPPARGSTPEWTRTESEEWAQVQAKAKAQVEAQAEAQANVEAHASTNHWLSDRHLLRARLDVKIENSSNYRNGILEGRTGFIRAQDRLAVPHVAKKPTVQVLVGLQHKMFKIPTQFVYLQTTTEREGETPKEAATSILSQVGATVIIIGEDTEGCQDYVGYVGEVISEYGAVRLDLLKVLPEGEIVLGFADEANKYKRKLILSRLGNDWPWHKLSARGILQVSKKGYPRKVLYTTAKIGGSLMIIQAKSPEKRAEAGTKVLSENKSVLVQGDAGTFRNKGHGSLTDGHLESMQHEQHKWRRRSDKTLAGSYTEEPKVGVSVPFACVVSAASRWEVPADPKLEVGGSEKFSLREPPLPLICELESNLPAKIGFSVDVAESVGRG